MENITLEGYEDITWDILGEVTVLGKTFYSLDSDAEDVVLITDENFNILVDDSRINLLTDLYVYFAEIGESHMAEALLPLIEE